MRFEFSNALGVTTSPTELIMSRTLILIAAASLVVISLALSAHAQQPPNATPGMVEMTEPPTPAPAGFNNRTNGFTEQAQFDRDRKAFEEVETILPETKDDNAATAGLRKRRSSANPPSSSRRDASSSFSARARWAMCIYRRKLRRISRRRAARYNCSPPPRRSMRSTGRMQRRSGFFT
jgi:hypothetical protein